MTVRNDSNQTVSFMHDSPDNLGVRYGISLPNEQHGWTTICSATFDFLAAGVETGPTGQSGIFDVRSGSDRTALDGTKYSDW
jgi:hypothetical protein